MDAPNELMKFLEDHEGDDIWVLVSGQLITGGLAIVKEPPGMAVEIFGAEICTPNGNWQCGNVNILISDISAWGNEIPVFEPSPTDV